MKSYSPKESPEFLDNIMICEETDEAHADNINEAPKQLLENDLVLNERVNNLNNPVYSTPTKRENLVSGENFKKAWGKLRRLFSDLTPVAFSGKYSDLDGTPDIPGKISELENDAGFITNSDIASKADKNSPIFTGTPKAPTASSGTNTTQIATTAFVQNVTDNKIADLINGAPTTLDTLGEIADAMTENESVVEALNDSIGKKIDTINGDTHIESTKSGSVATVIHKDVSRKNTSTTASPDNGASFTVISEVKSDSKGHITGVNTKIVKLPKFKDVDTALSDSSENPVQNKVVSEAIFEMKESISQKLTGERIVLNPGEGYTFEEYPIGKVLIVSSESCGMGIYHVGVTSYGQPSEMSLLCGNLDANRITVCCNSDTSYQVVVGNGSSGTLVVTML